MAETTRNLLAEIVERQDRSGFVSMFNFEQEFRILEEAFAENTPTSARHSNELLKFVPIASVAALQSFARGAVMSLVDSGEPYFSNVAQWQRKANIKLDYNLVDAVRSKTLTIGELTAHNLHFNSLESFIANLSMVCGLDLLTELKTFEPAEKWVSDVTNSKYFKENFSIVLDDLKRTFELRHRFCHELVTEELDREEIMRCLQHTKVLLLHVKALVLSYLFPNMPLTQAEMNQQSSEDFEVVNKELEQLIL